MDRSIISKFAALVFSILVGITVLVFNIYLLKDMFTSKAPYIGSFARHLRIMQDKLKLKKGATLIDLGCGDGKAMRFFRKHFQLGQIDGYEINPRAVRRSKLLNLIYKPAQLTIYKKSFEHADLSKYDYLYIYLLPEQMASIEAWVFKHITKDAVIISNSFQFAKHKPFKIIENSKGKPSIFLYKK